MVRQPILCLNAKRNSTIGNETGRIKDINYYIIDFVTGTNVTISQYDLIETRGRGNCPPTDHCCVLPRTEVDHYK